MFAEVANGTEAVKLSSKGALIVEAKQCGTKAEMEKTASRLNEVGAR